MGGADLIVALQNGLALVSAEQGLGIGQQVGQAVLNGGSLLAGDPQAVEVTAIATCRRKPVAPRDVVEDNRLEGKIEIAE